MQEKKTLVNRNNVQISYSTVLFCATDRTFSFLHSFYEKHEKGLKTWTPLIFRTLNKFKKEEKNSAYPIWRLKHSAGATEH